MLFIWGLVHTLFAFCVLINKVEESALCAKLQLIPIVEKEITTLKTLFQHIKTYPVFLSCLRQKRNIPRNPHLQIKTKMILLHPKSNVLEKIV